MRRTLAVAALAIVLGAVVGVQPAAATATGCTSSPTVCLKISGERTWIDYATVYRPLDVVSLCNWYTTFTVYSGTTILYTRTGSIHSGCATYYRPSQTFGVNRGFPTATRGCGSFFDRGIRVNTACLNIHA